MHIVNAQVPYAERCIFIEGGTAVILPFLNVAKGTDKNTSLLRTLPGYERADQCAVVRAVARNTSERAVSSILGLHCRNSGSLTRNLEHRLRIALRR